MKRVLTVILTALLAVTLMSCAQQETAGPSEMPAPSEPQVSAGAEETAGMANPWKEAADAAEVQELTGIVMVPVPDGSTDISYSVMESEKLAQVIFTWDGDQYTFRMVHGTPETDISGMFVDFETTEDLTWQDRPFTVSYNEGKEGKSEWHNAEDDETCSLTMSTGATRAKLAGITKALIPMG